MNLYTPKQLADSMRVVRKNTIAIAEDIPETQYDYRPSPDSRSVRETLLHIASMTHFDLHIHEEQRRDSMDGFDFLEFFAGLPTYGKAPFPRKRFWMRANQQRAVAVNEREGNYYESDDTGEKQSAGARRLRHIV